MLARPRGANGELADAGRTAAHQGGPATHKTVEVAFMSQPVLAGRATAFSG